MLPQEIGNCSSPGTPKGGGLTIARIQERTEALGPGARAVIWFHGCSFACPGCIAAEMNKSDDFAAVPPAFLARAVIGFRDIEGITLSGGDPFDQDLDALALFLQYLRQRSTLSVMCYTGRTLAQLRAGHKALVAERVLAHIDILVDGLYVEALNDGSVWRGSSNQQVHFLSERYKHLGEYARTSYDRKVEVSLDRRAQLHITGIPPSRFMERLSHGLGGRGFSLAISDVEGSA